jgi:hypothetical protein
MAVVTSMMAMSLPDRLRRAWPRNFISCLLIGILPGSKGRSPTRRPLAWLALLLLAAWPAGAAQFSIDAVRAAYLFRFASYVEWPAVEATGAPFVIGIYGAEDVAVHLERLTTNISIRGRPATVRRIRGVEDLQDVQILYVGPRVFRGARPLRERIANKPVLLVTDNRDGLVGGGVINFIEVNRNLRFEISLDAADRAGLKIDSALLSVAARVDKRTQR